MATERRRAAQLLDVTCCLLAILLRTFLHWPDVCGGMRAGEAEPAPGQRETRLVQQTAIKSALSKSRIWLCLRVDYHKPPAATQCAPLIENTCWISLLMQGPLIVPFSGSLQNTTHALFPHIGVKMNSLRNTFKKKKKLGSLCYHFQN